MTFSGGSKAALAELESVMALRTVVEAADLQHPAVDAAMATAASLLGMTGAYIAALTAEEFIFERLWGEIPGAVEGQSRPRAESMCHRLLAGATPVTADAAHDPVYADAPARVDHDITSYVGVVLEPQDGVDFTFCAVDSRAVPVTDREFATMRQLGQVVFAHLAPTGAVTIRRTPAGWRVAGSDESDLLSAMVLADLLSAQQVAGAAGAQVPPPAPPQDADEPQRLQHTVRQLEHALASRVVVEQAIGVLAERQRLAPRAAFERLRRAARSRGRRVVDLAREVVASTADQSVPLPPELAGRRPSAH